MKSLSLLVLLGVSSCAFFKSKKGDFGATELLTPMKSEWFAQNPSHALWNSQGKPQPHHFFDLNPELSRSDVFVNAIIVTPEGSDHQYGLDTTSGQRFYSHSYCSQSDIWGNYTGAISRPPYSIGAIPRLLDQTGEPQKVIIFGGARKFNSRTDFHEYRIRLVGAIIEQTCPEGNCTGKDNWVSRLVFLGIDPEDKKFDQVSDIYSLEKAINWKMVKAALENLEGRNGATGSSFPVTRIGQLIELKESMDYYKKRSIYLSQKETDKIRKSCHALYDRLWNEVGAEQPEDKPAKTVEELSAKLKLLETLKKKRPVGFGNRFKAFAEKYGNEFGTCQRYVYAGNLNSDRDKFWFYTYASIFFKLHKEGFYFDCRTKAWQKNVLDSNGRPVFSLKRGLRECMDRDFDKAMGYLPNFLAGLKMSEGTYYRFVDYDTHTFGTHQKLYSWVKVKSKKYDCANDPNQRVRKELRVFPEDVSWKDRDIKDIEDELKIIY
jgi:hypothetical protein